MGLVLFVDSLWESPYAFSCFVALHEKDLPFEVRGLDLARREQDEASYVAGSLTGRVPTLVHDDFWLSESTAILEYLEDAFPPPAHRALLPTDQRERARARQLLGWIRSDFLALREERPTRSMFFARADQPLSPAARKAADKVLRVVSAVLPEGRSTVFGDFTIVDADLAFVLMRLVLNGDPIPARLQAWAEGIWQRPSVQAFVVRERPPLE